MQYAYTCLRALQALPLRCGSWKFGLPKSVGMDPFRSDETGQEVTSAEASLKAAKQARVGRSMRIKSHFNRDLLMNIIELLPQVG